MRQIIRRFIEAILHRLAPPLPPPLEGLTATVFVRESNGSRTNLEHHFEQELIARGARVLLANQQAGTALVKQGEFTPLHTEAHFTVVGTLMVREAVEVTADESEHAFAVRAAEHKVWRERWLDTTYSAPEPQLEPRRKGTSTTYLHHQLSFRLIGRDGSLLASGTCEASPRAGRTSYEKTLRELARDAIAHLDGSNVWSHVVIT